MIEINSNFSQFYKPKNKQLELAKNKLREVLNNKFEAAKGPQQHSVERLLEFHNYTITDFQLFIPNSDASLDSNSGKLNSTNFSFIYEPLKIARKLDLKLRHFFSNESLSYTNTMKNYGLVPELNLLSMKLVNVDVPNIFENTGWFCKKCHESGRKWPKRLKKPKMTKIDLF